MESSFSKAFRNFSEIEKSFLSTTSKNFATIFQRFSKNFRKVSRYVENLCSSPYRRKSTKRWRKDMNYIFSFAVPIRKLSFYFALLCKIDMFSMELTRSFHFYEVLCTSNWVPPFCFTLEEATNSIIVRSTCRIQGSVLAL